jgi:predicted trehalose synthase
VFCSDRGRRGGCGRTFAVFFGDVLPRHSVTAALLGHLLAGLLTGLALKSAVEALHTAFAVETFYRLQRRLRRRLDVVRAWLCRAQSPPVSGRADPLLQTVEHLQAIAGGATGGVTGYQLRFQQPLLG